MLIGVWLIPAVLAPLIIRKPGAGVFAETVAAIISTFLGSPWGTITILYGLVQGAGGEAGVRGHVVPLVPAAGRARWRRPGRCGGRR